MVRSVVFASLEYGMTTAFISPELKGIQGAIKERYLQLTVSDFDEEAYLLDFYKGYHVLGKITKYAEGNEYESRSTAVYHLYFMDEEDLIRLQRKMEDNFFPIFISNATDGFYRAEKLQFDVYSVEKNDEEEESSRELQELSYLKVLEFLQENYSVRIRNLLFDNKSVFYFLMTRFDISNLSKIDIRIGCKKAYYNMSCEEGERNCLCICKDDENAIVDLVDIFHKPLKAPYSNLKNMSDYYRLPAAKRHVLRETLETFIEENKKRSFEVCVDSCIDYTMSMMKQMEQYRENSRSKKRCKKIKVKVKRINKTLRKVEKLLQTLSKEGAVLKELEEV